ncbi:TPA: glycosyltransferase family 61 protein [Citrobacter freundii]|nr:glycosyltransferase family 61 protein [Citrobacter freundii]MDK5876392.1 glycosyltransferase family 61 protein [Citrobacter freundii]HCR3763789.1 glycosyltransferase family 61 protein [Citrobacter freundii]
MSNLHTDKSEACEILRDSDIWLDNDNVDMFKVSNLLNELLKLGDFDTFEYMVRLLKDSTLAEKIKFRLTRAEAQRDSILHIINKAEGTTGISRVILKPYGTNKTSINSLDDIFYREQGLYFRNQNGSQYSSFDDVFSGYKAEDKTTFKDKGFSRNLSQHNQEKFRIINNARVHTFNHNFYAISDEDGCYDASNAARLAKLSHVNYINSYGNSADYIDKAVFLPIDHACNNYYHALSECFGGLKFISELPSDIPIIYTEDRFEVLDFIAARLCIDRSRFISIKSLSNTIVRKALQLYPYSFTWSQDIFLFFKGISYPQTSQLKIYVSRRKSSRGPSNELDVETELQGLGFDILYAEELSFSEQVRIFSNASILVSPHGAGLTNILFMPKSSALVEIFNRDYIQPDFYLRSQHNEMKYACSIQSDSYFNIDELKEAIARCDR